MILIMYMCMYMYMYMYMYMCVHVYVYVQVSSPSILTHFTVAPSVQGVLIRGCTCISMRGRAGSERAERKMVTAVSSDWEKNGSCTANPAIT